MKKESDSNEVSTPVDQAGPVSETPVEHENESPVETPESEGLDEVLAQLGSIDVGEEGAPETPNDGVDGGGVPVQEVDPEINKLKAKLTAAAVTGTLSTGIERFMKPVVVTDEMRVDFAGALAPVLEKRGVGMPVWLAKLLDEWEAELELARKVVAIGWAIKEQRDEIKAGGEKPKRRLPKEMTTRYNEGAACA